MLGRSAEGALAAVGLIPVLEMTAGAPEIQAALIDGPVAADHPDLVTENIRSLSAGDATASGNGVATAHGTYVAGMLAARRGSSAPAICPGCTLLVRPIFLQTASDELPSATPDEVADAVAECVDAGARVVNLSVAVASPSPNKEQKLEEALSYAAHRGAIVVAAAGKQGTIGSSAITRHVWVIPVAACDLRGQPIAPSNLGASIGRRGLRAGRGRYQPRHAGRTGHVRRNERRGSLPHGNRRVVVVGVSDRNCNRDRWRWSSLTRATGQSLRPRTRFRQSM